MLIVDLIKELFLQSKEVAKERIKSPLFSSFSLFWLIFNWKAPFILFLSKSDIEAKIASIESNFTWQTSFLYPVLGTLFYLILYPPIALLAFSWRNNNAKRKENLKIDNEYYVKKIEIIRGTQLIELKIDEEIAVSKTKMELAQINATIRDIEEGKPRP